MAQHPADAGEALYYAAEDQLGSGQRRVKQETAERHQPIFGHRFHAYGTCGMDVEHGLPVIGRFIERPEALVTQRNTVDVAENHCTWKSELRCGSLELRDGCSRI